MCKHKNSCNLLRGPSETAALQQLLGLPQGPANSFQDVAGCVECLLQSCWVWLSFRSICPPAGTSSMAAESWPNAICLTPICCNLDWSFTKIWRPTAATSPIASASWQWVIVAEVFPTRLLATQSLAGFRPPSGKTSPAARVSCAQHCVSKNSLKNSPNCPSQVLFQLPWGHCVPHENEYIHPQREFSIHLRF